MQNPKTLKIVAIHQLLKLRKHLFVNNLQTVKSSLKGFFGNGKQKEQITIILLL